MSFGKRFFMVHDSFAMALIQVLAEKASAPIAGLHAWLPFGPLRSLPLLVLPLHGRR
jgi:hypothetical protein